MTVETTNPEAEDITGVTDPVEPTEEATVVDAEPDDDPEAEPDDDAETFPRTYVEKLRRENQRYRDQAATADGFAQRLHTALVAATGKLADPTDLDFDAAHLAEDDPDALAAAIDELLARKPHLASRRVFGDIGQGATRTEDAVDLAGMLRNRT